VAVECCRQIEWPCGRDHQFFDNEKWLLSDTRIIMNLQ
jgi:hypothetical protein